MKKLFTLSIFICILSSCSIDRTPTPYWAYTVGYNPVVGQYGETHWAAHNISMLEPINKPYEFLKCYVDNHRDRDDWPSQNMVQNYDKDTNNVYLDYKEDHNWDKNPSQNPYGLRALDCAEPNRMSFNPIDTINCSC